MSPERAASCTRRWARAYTLGLPSDVRRQRLDEIDSDLWESLHDQDDEGRQILPRLLFGVIDDLRWRAGLVAPSTRASIARLGALAVVLLIVVRATETAAYREFVLASTWVYPIVSSLHVLGLVMFLGLTTMFDLRLVGLTLRRVPVTELVERVLPWAVAGAVLAVITGFLTFLAEPARFLGNVFFQIKTAALVIALVNMWVFHATVYRRVREWDTAPVTPVAARTAGYVSLGLWSAVVVTGRLIAYSSWF